MKVSLPYSNPSSVGAAWQEAERLGIDTSLLLANLRRTPLERIRAHDRAVSMAMAIRKAVNTAVAVHEKRRRIFYRG